MKTANCTNHLRPGTSVNARRTIQVRLRVSGSTCITRHWPISSASRACSGARLIEVLRSSLLISLLAVLLFGTPGLHSLGGPMASESHHADACADEADPEESDGCQSRCPGDDEDGKLPAPVHVLLLLPRRVRRPGAFPPPRRHLRPWHAGGVGGSDRLTDGAPMEIFQPPRGTVPTRTLSRRSDHPRPPRLGQRAESADVRPGEVGATPSTGVAPTKEGATLERATVGSTDPCLHRPGLPGVGAASRRGRG